MKRKMLENQLEILFKDIEYNYEFLADEFDYFKSHLTKENQKFIIQDIIKLRMSINKLSQYIRKKQMKGD